MKENKKEPWNFAVYHDLAKFNQENQIPDELRLELQIVVEGIVIFALNNRAKEESKTGKKIRRFFKTIFGKEIKKDGIINYNQENK